MNLDEIRVVERTNLKKKMTKIIEEFDKVRTHTVRVCEPLLTEDYIPQPAAFVSPPKWHLAHTSWFFEEMILKKFDPAYKEFSENSSFLFNS